MGGRDGSKSKTGSKNIRRRRLVMLQHHNRVMSLMRYVFREI